jgi:hypothetical protein
MLFASSASNPSRQPFSRPLPALAAIWSTVRRWLVALIALSRTAGKKVQIGSDSMQARATFTEQCWPAQ